MGKKYIISKAASLLLIMAFILSSVPVIAVFHPNGAQPPITYVTQLWFNWGSQSNAITIDDSSTEEEIVTPEYQLSSHLNNPAAYVKGTTITVKVKFHSTASSLYIKATGSFGGLPQTYVTFTNGESNWITFTASSSIPSSIGINSVTWNWYLKTSLFSQWSLFNITSHTVYAVNKQPLTDFVWKEIVGWTCDWCQGLPDDDKQIADAILTGYDQDEVIQYGMPGQTTPEILRNGGGMCGGMKEVFYDSCATQGVYAPGFFFVLKTVNTAEKLWIGIVCKDPGLGRTTPGYESVTKTWFFVDSVYPYPDFYSNYDPNDDVTIESDTTYYEFYSPNDGHAINLLEYDDEIYLYDLSFGHGPYSGIFDEMPNTGNHQSADISDFRQNYFNLAVDDLEGKIYHYNSNHELILDDQHFSVKTSIVPDEVNNVNQLLLWFGFTHTGLSEEEQYVDCIEDTINGYSYSALTQDEENTLNAWLNNPSNPADWQELSSIVMKLGKPLNETQAVEYLNETLAIQTEMSAKSGEPVPNLLDPLDLMHYCAEAALNVINE
jgi:hypothetical protein